MRTDLYLCSCLWQTVEMHFNVLVCIMQRAKPEIKQAAKGMQVDIKRSLRSDLVSRWVMAML